MRTGFPPWQHEWISYKLRVVVVVVIASDLMHAATAAISIALVVLILFFLIFYTLVLDDVTGVQDHRDSSLAAQCSSR